MPFIDVIITSEEVKAIANLVETDLSVYIDIAKSVIITSLEGKEELTEDYLKTICLYLSAHFAYIKEGQVKSEKIGDSSTTFNIESGLGLNSTTFGQQAIMLDFTGTLKTLTEIGNISNKIASIFSM